MTVIPATKAKTFTAGWRTTAGTLATLFKLRIVALLLLAATTGAFIGSGGWPGAGNLLHLWLSGGMAAAGASALNQYLERESDSLMGRTRRRPLASGAITHTRRVLWLAAGLILLPALAILPFKPALTFFLLLGAIIYVGIYTLWLKPRTLLNIVVGGAAGSAAVLSGGAAAGTWQAPQVLVLALLLFLWTPSHFWSLAILYRDEYRKAGMPMLPAQTGRGHAAWWVLLHSVATGVAALALAVVPALGLIYFVPTLLATGYLLRRNIVLLRRPDPVNARAMFVASNLYLMIVLLTLLVASLLR